MEAERALDKVEYPRQGTANVRWINNDGSYLRCGYIRDQKDDFIRDIEDPVNGGKEGDAAPYIEILGW